MIPLLTTSTQPSRHGLKHLAWQKVETEFKRNFKTYHNWFDNPEQYVANNFLENLILNIGADYNDPLPIYLSKVKGRIDDVAAIMNVVGINKGDFISDLYYNTNVGLIFTENGFVNTSWKNRTPLKVVGTTETDYRFFDMLRDTVSNDPVYVELDVIELLGMYRSYKLSGLDKDVVTSVGEFIARYVIPNSFKSFLNLSLVNRFIMPELTEVPDRVGIPMSFIDPSRNLIDEDWRDTLFFREELLGYYLQSIATVGENGLTSISVSGKGETTNEATIIIAAKLPIIVALLNRLSQNAKDGNRQYTTQIWYRVASVHRGNYFKKSPVITTELVDLVEEFLKEYK